MLISNEKYADGEMHIIGTENYLFEIEFNPYVDEFIVKVSFGIHTEDGDIIYIEDRNNNESNIHRMSESELLEFLKRINESDPLNIGDTILLKVLEFLYDITLKLVRTLYDGCVKNIFMTKDGDVISGTCFKCADGYRITDP